MSSLDGTDPLEISLSAREIEIIELVAEGLTNQEIADRLTISKRTVDNHVSNVFTKTGSKNRVALLNWAMDNGKICRDGFNCCVLPEHDPSGFSIEVLANKFESTFRSMCSDGRVLAEYLFSHLEEKSTAMLNSFLEGRFRRGDDKNSPYKDSGQLKDMFRRDIEDTFKNGFTRIEFKNHFDKHYCDYTIKEFLISLGYNSFKN